MAATLALDLTQYLDSKGIKTHRAAGLEVTAHCFFCPDGDSKGRGKLYLNTESWLYDCKRCGETGNRRTLLRHFGDDDAEYLPGTDPSLRRLILGRAVEVAHAMLLGSDRHLTDLFDRGLTPETVERARLGLVPRGFILSKSLGETFAAADLMAAGLITARGDEFFSDSLLIPYHSHGSVTQVRERRHNPGDGAKYRTAAGDPPQLYNADSLRSATDVVVCEGELDCLILQQHLGDAHEPRLRTTSVVALPGVHAWPADLAGYFESARRVFIGFDADQPGRDAAVKLRTELGTKSRVLDLPRELPKCDWTEYLREPADGHPHAGHTWRDVASMLTEADLAGKRMFSVWEAHAKWDHQRVGHAGVEFGWPTYDAIVRPGSKPGHLVIPLANTGTGKSVWLSNLAHNTRSRRTLMVSMELTAEQVYEHLYRIHEFWFPGAPPEQVVESYANLRIADPNRLRRGDLEALIEEYAEEIGEPPELVPFDYLQYYARGFSGASSYDTTTAAIHELKAVAKEYRCVMVCPSQVNRGVKHGQAITMSDARDSGAIEETADQVISLVRPDMRTDDHGTPQPMTGAYNMQILKNRGPGQGRVIHGLFSNMSLVIVDKFDRVAAHRVEVENREYAKGVHYDEWRRLAARPAQLQLVGGAS